MNLIEDARAPQVRCRVSAAQFDRLDSSRPL